VNEPVSRRNFLRAAMARVARAAGELGGDLAPASVQGSPWEDGKAWKAYEITLQVALPAARSHARLWLPMPLPMDTDYCRSLGRSWKGNARRMEVHLDIAQGAAMFCAEWDAHATPSVELKLGVTLRDRAINFSHGGPDRPLSDFDRALYTRATTLLPTDGIVREKALEVIGDAETEVARARAIFDWIIANGYRDAEAQGCGRGDICALLAGGPLAGRCADLNGLFVGMVRSLGIPAREVFGLRVAPCQWGYQSLGIAAGGIGNATRAQHCRAEFHADSQGWVPVDPADVLKVAMDEPPGKLAPTHPKVELVHDRLFGAWEMNWLPYNYAHDLALPGSEGPVLGHFLYPVAEVDGQRRDSLAPESFSYAISSRVL
jgi:transglutaminase-like putative cysteine protease